MAKQLTVTNANGSNEECVRDVATHDAVHEEDLMSIGVVSNQCCGKATTGWHPGAKHSGSLQDVGGRRALTNTTTTTTTRLLIAQQSAQAFT